MSANETDNGGGQVVDLARKTSEINGWRLCVAPMLDCADTSKKPKQINRLGSLSFGL